MDWIIQIDRLKKRFFLQTQGNAEIPVFDNFQMTLNAGESVGLVGPSGAGKSTLLRLMYGNYVTESGRIQVLHKKRIVDIATAGPHTVLDIRKWTIGYVSQFLRVIPRVPALQVVMEPLRERGVAEISAREQAESLLARLRIPRRLWALSPTTFSGGEQQRINIARGFIAPFPVMILDEPTASLDPVNKKTVKELILEARGRGTAVVGIFHDPADRSDLVTRTVDIPLRSNGR
ncbi:MAG: phosphonate C-P lyase system protein PhnL [Desulfobacteraceae bacterium]|nr:MAG: phosphonate C-P lyase system protein PhnL [Desulfobacteraceae bacterium]